MHSIPSSVRTLHPNMYRHSSFLLGHADQANVEGGVACSVDVRLLHTLRRLLVRLDAPRLVQRDAGRLIFFFASGECGLLSLL